VNRKIKDNAFEQAVQVFEHNGRKVCSQLRNLNLYWHRRLIKKKKKGSKMLAQAPSCTYGTK
jgi:hypothetical protein